MKQDNVLKINDQYYILASSAVAEQKAVALKYEEAFGVVNRYGDIKSLGGESIFGMYFEGTRYLSDFELLVGDKTPFILSSGLNEENEMHVVDLTNTDTSAFETYGQMDKGTVHVQRQQFLYEDIYYENIYLCSYANNPITLKLSLLFNADFKDIFEVRGMKREFQGTLHEPQYIDNEIIFSYSGLDGIHRTTRIGFNIQPVFLGDRRADFEIVVHPLQCFNIYISIAFELNNQRVNVLENELAKSEMISSMYKRKSMAAQMTTNNHQFNRWLKRSGSDLFTMITRLDTGPYPYAGIPWYSTPFGRDGIISALECLWDAPIVGQGVLKYLASTQAKEFNDLADAEPGKILHEKREGEMANTGEIPFKMYYGTIDATPLFICLAGVYFDRTGDMETIKEIWPNIELALEWMDKYGDKDGDGFLEYERKASSGLGNQGWKDSWEAIFHEDGTLAQTPIALCEVQAYAYLAKLKGAQLAHHFDKPDMAEKLVKEAQELKEKFAEAFWSEDKQTYVLALDGNKKQCNVSSSNAGHCLVTGISKPEHAAKVAKNLMSKKMYSGWGIRTIANDEKLYNPMSYHNGSVWPHDNAIIALGLGRYGFYEDVNRIMTGLFEAAQSVDSFRLPELFCGFEKIRNQGLVNYPVACSPQSWAVGSVFILLQACLGMRINAKENSVYFYKPTLPDYLNEVTISNLQVNDSHLTLQIRKSEGKVYVEILSTLGRPVNVEIVYEFPMPEVLKTLQMEFNY